ncbi:MAG TPA: adenylate/guanylate cyclase domain-containing protein [Stellaceae bacterium]|jgi:class 3 adenylate cyclase|nr:adenylate/guanylate cyclase domain-containing protein [Stellaceae bacterium]
MNPMTEEAEALFAVLRQSSDAETVAAIEELVRDAPDRALCRINVLNFATARHLDEERVIAAFLHAARLGVFELSWNVVCPGCGGVLGEGTALTSVRHDDYVCALCATGYEASLDTMVEVTFTVSRRARRIAAHDPHELPFVEYFRQIFWASAMDLPDDLDRVVESVTLDTLELPAHEKAQLSLQLPPEFLIVFEPVTHMAQFIEVKGEPTRERQNLSLAFTGLRAPTTTIEMRPGPLRLSFENRTDGRLLPGLWIAGDGLHHLLDLRHPFLSAKRMLTNQVFRDLYGTETLDPEQRLKITSLTFLFTDLKGSTPLYQRVGDLAAFDLVRQHFHVLHEIVAAESGAIVKTIGDAVMATFHSPDRAMAAALRMREAMQKLNAERGSEDLTLKIGIHEGPCLAVVLNDRQDFFGQTVNIAARVQGLATSRSIFATGPVVENAQTSTLLAAQGLAPVARQRSLRGVAENYAVYEIP